MYTRIQLLGESGQPVRFAIPLERNYLAAESDTMSVAMPTADFIMFRSTADSMKSAVALFRLLAPHLPYWLRCRRHPSTLTTTFELGAIPGGRDPFFARITADNRIEPEVVAHELLRRFSIELVGYIANRDASLNPTR